MGVIWSKTKFSEISKSHYLFSNYNYFLLRKEIDRDKSFLVERIADYFYIISGFAFSSKDYQDEGVLVCRIGDISKTSEIILSNMKKLPTEYTEKYKSYLIKNGDILIGMTGDGKYFKTGFIKNLTQNILLNQRVGILRLKETKKETFNPKFLSLLLRTNKVQNQIRIVAMGKTQKNVSPFDILNVKFPRISFKKQNEIANKITPIEQEIKQLKERKKDILGIINEVIGDELGFDWEKFEELKKQKIFTSSLLEFSNNIDCRFAFRFQHKSGKFMIDFLKSKTSKRIKDYLEIPISLGSGISPSQYDEDGEYYYISMATVKNYYFEKNDAKKVSYEYSDSNQNKTVQKNDIIMTRSGMAIGKFALIEDDDIKGIYADFTMRIRLKDYITRLAYYYFRSDFFQHLITTNKKGLQNHNIFPSQIQEFPIPDWPEEQQTEIVKKIKSRIDAQKEIDKQIKEKQNEISELIEKAIKENANAKSKSENETPTGNPNHKNTKKI